MSASSIVTERKLFRGTIYVSKAASRPHLFSCFITPTTHFTNAPQICQRAWFVWFVGVHNTLRQSHFSATGFPQSPHVFTNLNLWSASVSHVRVNLSIGGVTENRRWYFDSKICKMLIRQTDRAKIKVCSKTPANFMNPAHRQSFG